MIDAHRLMCETNRQKGRQTDGQAVCLAPRHTDTVGKRIGAKKT